MTVANIVVGRTHKKKRRIACRSDLDSITAIAVVNDELSSRAQPGGRIPQ